MKRIQAILYGTLILTFLITSCAPRKFSFAVMSDIHLKGDDVIQRELLDSVIALLNNSEEIIRDSTGISVGKPMGVFVTGDLTDSGKPEQWRDFEDIFGLSGNGDLKIPVYETFGNHDGGVNGAVREGIKGRNSQRKNLSMISENGLHYALETNGYLFVVLGSYPGGQWDPGCEWCHYFRESFRESEGSLSFLEEVLGQNNEGKKLPVFLFFHYGWDDFSRLWWTEAEQDRFFNAMTGSRIAAIFHGHNHQIDSYMWRGYDVFIAGSPLREGKTGEALMVSVTGDDIRVFVISNFAIRKLE